MKFAQIISIMAILAFTVALDARAHSTKGRVKVPLDKDELCVDDLAYYVESYVHRHLYKGKKEPSKQRFYVKEFIRLDQLDKRATIHFEVLDNKTKGNFKDAMVFVQQPDGQWVNPQPAAPRLKPVFTYVAKNSYRYKKYVLPLSGVGLAVGGVVLLMLRVRRFFVEKKAAA